jgi:hypothetical protein
MSTLDELRETLGRQADGFDDTGRASRSASVRRRVRIARRRRSSALAVAAAVVLAGGVGVATSFPDPRRPQVAGPSVVGVAVPDEISILGFSYDLAGQDPFEDGGGRIELDASEEQRAVSLVGRGLGSGSATLFVDDAAVARVFAGAPVSVPVPVPSDLGAVLRVELHDTPADARTGVAVYDATGELAPGVDNGEAVFRETVADRRLLAADFSDDDGTSATLTYSTPLSDTTITSWCSTKETGLWMEVLVDGAVTSRGTCGDTTDPDAFGSGFSPGDPQGGPHTVEARVTRGGGGEVVPDAAARLGVAVYEGGATVGVAGTDVAEVVEHAGRTWRLDLHEVGAVLGIKAETDLLVGFVAEGRWLRATWRGDLTTGSTGELSSTSGPATITDGLMLAGDTYAVRLVSDRGPVVNGALLVYRPE